MYPCLHGFCPIGRKKKAKINILQSTRTYEERRVQVSDFSYLLQQSIKFWFEKK
jgi:hypothetical protein